MRSEEAGAAHSCLVPVLGLSASRGAVSSRRDGAGPPVWAERCQRSGGRLGSQRRSHVGRDGRCPRGIGVNPQGASPGLQRLICTLFNDMNDKNHVLGSELLCLRTLKGTKKTVPEEAQLLSSSDSGSR